MNKWIWFVVMMIFHLLTIAHSSCVDICELNKGSIVLDNDDIAETVVKTIDNDEGHKINCFDTSKVTDMSYLFDSYDNEIFEDFNEDISCWDTSGVTNMSVSR